MTVTTEFDRLHGTTTATSDRRFGAVPLCSLSGDENGGGVAVRGRA
jgi:hypothetical protein